MSIPNFDVPYVCTHEWRLFTRDNMDRTIESYINDYPLRTYKEFWYCIKCRQEDTRIVTDAR